MVRRNRKTVYGWIATGEIGEADGLFVVQGRFLIHWPTFRAKQFKPLEKLRGQVPDFSEQTENGMARNGQTLGCAKFQPEERGLGVTFGGFIEVNEASPAVL